jgi:hypothetical protein
MHIHKYIQPHIIIIFFHQHVSVTPVTISSVSYSKNTIIMQVIVQKCMIKPLDITLIWYDTLVWYYSSVISSSFVIHFSTITPVTIIKVSHNNTISIQVTVQECMINHLTLHSSVISSGYIIHFCTVTSTLIVFLSYNNLMVVTGVIETCWWRIIVFDRTYL